MRGIFDYRDLMRTRDGREYLRSVAELAEYDYQHLMTTPTGKERFQWNNEYFVDLSPIGTASGIPWTGWATSGGETMKGEGLKSLTIYLKNYHS